MSNPSDNEEEAPPAEAEVVDEMETITASVEETSLSENTPDEQPPSETKTPTKEFESTPGKEDQGLLFSPSAILPELSARRTLFYEVPKGREAKAITSRRQKLRKQDKEGYAASLEKERKRKYLLKNRNRGLGDPPASVGVDSPNPDGGVAGEPPASVGEVTQPPTGGDGETGGQKRKRTFTVVKKKAGGRVGRVGCQNPKLHTRPSTGCNIVMLLPINPSRIDLLLKELGLPMKGN